MVIHGCTNSVQSLLIVRFVDFANDVIFFAGSHTLQAPGQCGDSCVECEKLVAKGALCEHCEHRRRLACRDNPRRQVAAGRARLCEQADSDDMEENTGEYTHMDDHQENTEVPGTATRRSTRAPPTRVFPESKPAAKKRLGKTTRKSAKSNSPLKGIRKPPVRRISKDKLTSEVISAETCVCC